MPGPFQRFLLVYKGSHLNGLTVFNGINVGNSYLVPSVATPTSDPHVNQNNNSITGDDELFRFTGPLRYASLRLCEIPFYPLNPVIGAAAGKLCRFAPLDSAVKRL